MVPNLITAAIVWILLGWFGARSFQPFVASDTPRVGSRAHAAAGPNSTPAIQSGLPTAGLPQRFGRASTWETLSNAVAQGFGESQGDRLERRTLAAALLDLPHLVPLTRRSTNGPGVLATEWDPTGRRRVEIRSPGTLWSILPVSQGQADDLLELEHPNGVTATSLLSGLGTTNHIVAVRYSNRDCLLWDTELAVVLTHLTNVPLQTQLCLSADGTLLTLTRADAGWSASQSVRRGKTTPNNLRVGNLAASAAYPSPDGQSLALVGQQRDSLSLCPTAGDDAPRAIPVSPPVSTVAWSTDGQWLAIVEGNRLLTFRDARSLALLQSIMIPGAPVTDLKVVPGKPGVLTLDENGVLRLWSPFCPDSLGHWKVQGHVLWVDSAAERVGVRHATTGDWELFRLDWGSLRATLVSVPPTDRTRPSPATFLGDGGTVAVPATGEFLQWTATLTVERLSSGAPAGLQFVHSAQPPALWIAASNQVLRGAIPDSGAPTFSADSPTFLDSDRPIRWLAVDATGSHLALLHEDRIALRSLAARPLEIRQPEPLESLVLSPDGAVLAASALRGTIHLYNTTTGREIGSLPSTPRSAMAITRDNTRLVLGNSDGYAVWSLQERSQQQILLRSGRGGSGPILALATTNDRLVVSDAEGWIQIHDGPRFEPILRLQLITRRSPTALAMSPGGRWVGAMDGTVMQVWDLKERVREMRKLSVDVPEL